MRIFYPIDRTGSRVVVSSGFIEGYNDDHSDSNLKGLESMTVSFNDDFRVTDIHFRPGDLKRWAGPHLGALVALVREWAQEQKPPKNSGFRPAFKFPPTEALEPKPEASTPKVAYVSGKYVVRKTR